jgi:hypothetical protein
MAATLATLLCLRGDWCPAKTGTNVSKAKPLIELYLALPWHWGSEFHESAPCRCRMVKYELDNGLPNSGASRIGFHILLLADSVASTAPQCLKE